MVNNSKILAVIPARSKSKGIINKNLKKINGKSLIKHAVEVAIKSNIFDLIILTSDSIKYKKEVEIYGDKVDFILRSPKISNDKSNSLSAWRDAILKTQKKYNTNFEKTILIEPTNPTRTIKDLKQLYKYFNNNIFNSVLTVSETPGSYTEHKSLILIKNKIQYLKSNGHKYTIRQKIPKQFHRNGIGYIADTKHIMLCKDNFICNNTGYIIVSKPNINIDTILDLKIARLLMQND